MKMRVPGPHDGLPDGNLPVVSYTNLIEFVESTEPPADQPARTDFFSLRELLRSDNHTEDSWHIEQLASVLGIPL